ncbi:MAG: SDR family oxidoreductase [Candidatus Brocadiia bacterium]
MATYVVTGGAGFIGSNIVSRLVEDGQEVRAIDDLSTGRGINLDGLRDVVTVYDGSVCDAGLLRKAFEDADYVLHQAALASVQRSVESPIETNRVNVEGTLQVLEAARESGVRRVVYASSSSVYGDAPELPKHEDMKPQPKSPYAVSKLGGEHYCCVYSEVFGLETVSLRYFNVFGPRQDPASQYAAVIPIFVRRMLSGESPQVYGDGEQSRDFTYVDNVVQANLLAATAEGAGGAVCNVGCGERYTLNELIELLQDLIGSPVDPEYGPKRAGDVKHSLADITRAWEVLGYEPDVDFREGLRRTVEWYREQLSQ